MFRSTRLRREDEHYSLVAETVDGRELDVPIAAYPRSPKQVDELIRRNFAPRLLLFRPGQPPRIR